MGANVAPKVSSFHWGSSASAPADSPAGGEGFLNDWEKSLNDPDGTMQKVQAYQKKTGQKTEMVRAAATIRSERNLWVHRCRFEHCQHMSSNLLAFPS